MLPVLFIIYFPTLVIASVLPIGCYLVLSGGGQ